MFNLRPTTFSHRAAALASVLLMHGLVIYSLSCLFLYSRSRERPAILEVRVFPRSKPPMDPLALPAVELQKSAPTEVVPPEFVSELRTEQAPIAVEKLPDQPVPPEIDVVMALPPEFGVAGPLIGPRPISGPHTPHFYPPKSYAAHERGRVAMIICITSGGKVDDVKLAASSGYPRLDEAGLNIAAQYRFKPATRAGVPVAACVRYQINFRIDI